MKRIHILSALLALALCACGCGFLNGLDNPKMEEESSGVYRVTIPAAMAELPTTFRTTDKIYLYNNTKDAFASDKSGNPTALRPAEIGDDGATCVLSGSVSFYKYNDNTERWSLVTPGEADTYSLFYNLSDIDPEDPYACYFNYEGQDGSAESALAHYYAYASGFKMNTVGSTARFSGVQSMVSMVLSFRRDGATVNPTLKRLTISTGEGTLARIVYALTSEVRPDDLVLTNPAGTELYLSMAFEPDNEFDHLILQAQDTQGNFYDAVAQMPPGGFVPGGSYGYDIPFDYSMSLKAPTVTRSDGGSEDELTPNADNTYEIKPKGGKIAIRIDGDCSGYNFVLTGKSTVTLAGNGTAYYPFYGCFIASLFNDLSVVLDSDYTVKCPNWMSAIMADVANLKLSTTGGTYKLTVVAQSSETYTMKGLKGDNYYAVFGADPADLAANGFTVTLSSEQDNGDGTGTFVYTVAPAN